MMKKMFTSIVLTIFFLTGCSSTPTRINGLNLDPTLVKGIDLNGILVSDGEKFILDKSFTKPTVPHDREPNYTFGHDRHFRGVVDEFTSIPAGPWEFNGTTLFPSFKSSRFRCFDRKVYNMSKETDYCDEYSQLEGPFIDIDCNSLTPPRASMTYRQRLDLVEWEKRKREKEDVEVAEDKTNNDAEYSAGEIVAGSVGVGLLATAVLVMAPVAIINRGLAKLGACGSTGWIWFNHDKFFDTVKETITSDYESIDAYIVDIRQASMAYKILANLDENKRKRIEALIREWQSSAESILPANDSIDNYPINFTPYSLVKIPRKVDWSKRPAAIEVQLLSHYTEQLSSVNEQIDSHNNVLKQKYSIHLRHSP